MLAGLLLLQAVAGPLLPPELRKRAARAPMLCPVQTDPDGEIVVCARPTEQRLAKLPEPAQPPPFDPLSFRLPGVVRVTSTRSARSYLARAGRGPRSR
ncbi:hypothetical protein O6W96_16370 [Sphingomonas faeni]